jgi:hypothetical protein
MTLYERNLTSIINPTVPYKVNRLRLNRSPLYFESGESVFDLLERARK